MVINKEILQSEYLFARGESETAYEHLKQVYSKFQTSPFIGRIQAAMGYLYLLDSRLFEAETITNCTIKARTIMNGTALTSILLVLLLSKFI